MGKKLQVFKIGGNVIDNPKMLTNFLRYFTSIDGKKILVHGGGKKATEFSEKLGIKTTMVEGRRVTNLETLDITLMVYAGLVNKKIVAELQSLGCNAMGISGADGNAITATVRPKHPVDYGWVGDVNEVNSTLFQTLLIGDIIPVSCALTHDGNGNMLNTNADTIAAEISKALAPEYDVDLIYCFEKKGVLEDVENENSVVSEIDFEKFREMKELGQVHQGMLPKLENAFSAVHSGVNRVIIGNPESIKAGFENCTTILS